MCDNQTPYHFIKSTKNKIEKSWKFLDGINWKKCIRFSLYGSLFIAPTLYCWVRIAHRIFPQLTLTSALKKAALEQITYGPISLSAFFLIMTYAETKSFDTAKQELRTKFWDTYKVCQFIFTWIQISSIFHISSFTIDCRVLLAYSTNHKFFLYSGS